jgi:SAM-dependent methyltransferase
MCYKNDTQVGLAMNKMDSELISRLNELWEPIYPFLARWISKHCPRMPGLSLEMGPFSGGISRGFIGLFQDTRTVCLMSENEVADTVRKQFGPKMEILVGSLERLPFVASFDVAVFRGAFFFLTPPMIRETYRILKPGGRALLGGGYGPLTPSGEITKIADESKRLNDRLGKRRISKGELEHMVREAEMEKYSEILEEGGLWLLLKRT